MDQSTLLIIVAVVAVVVIALIVWGAMRKRRTDRLRDQFGDEYDRTVEQRGKKAEAEAALEERAERVEKLNIRPLTPEERDGFSREWRDVKALFVDSPVEAVHHGDRLLGTIMKTRGYPMADFDRRYEDLTVDHGEVARHYREGHDIVTRHQNGKASTEDLRQAMIHFEALFDDLVNEVSGEVENPPVKQRMTTNG